MTLGIGTWLASAIAAVGATGSAMFGAYIGHLPPTPALPGVYVAPVETLAGDDNGDGFIMEDESGWDCRVHGNGICGPEVPPAQAPEFPTDTTVCYPEWTGAEWVWLSEYTLDGTCEGTRYGS